MHCISLMVTTKQNLTVDAQKIKGKESKHTITENYQVINEEGFYKDFINFQCACITEVYNRKWWKRK